jgi:hypothetical protein
MQRALGLAIAFAGAGAGAVACGSGTPLPADAAIDAKHGLGFGSACTTVSDTSTECTSGVCTNTFNQFPTPLCSQKCTILGGSDSTCPVGSMGQKCNQQGYCRP